MIILKTPFCKILTQTVLIIPLNCCFFFQNSSGHKSVNSLPLNLKVNWSDYHWRTSKFTRGPITSHYCLTITFRLSVPPFALCTSDGVLQGNKNSFPIQERVSLTILSNSLTLDYQLIFEARKRKGLSIEKKCAFPNRLQSWPWKCPRENWSSIWVAVINAKNHKR